MRNGFLKAYRIAAVALIMGRPAFAQTPTQNGTTTEAREQAQTVMLNRDIAFSNAAADSRYRAQKLQYDDEKKRYEEAQRKYILERDRNRSLNQVYQDRLREYRTTYPMAPRTSL